MGSVDEVGKEHLSLTMNTRYELVKLDRCGFHFELQLEISISLSPESQTPRAPPALGSLAARKVHPRSI